MRQTIRERLAHKLADHFQAFTLLGSDLQSARGHWRTHKHADCLKWDAQITTNDGRMLHIGSYHTMGECLKYGFVVTHIERNRYAIDAKKP